MLIGCDVKVTGRDAHAGKCEETESNNLLYIIGVKLMPLVGSWLSANLVVRVLFGAPHVQYLYKAIYI